MLIHNFCYLLLVVIKSTGALQQLIKAPYQMPHILLSTSLQANSGKGQPKEISYGKSNSAGRMPERNRRSSASSSPKNNIKQLKTARVLRDELSDIICSGDIKANVYPDENLMRSVTVLNVELSADLSLAKVSISASGNSVERRQMYVWLNENIGQVRHSLTKRLRSLRRVPIVSFELADTQSSFYLSEVMDNLSSSSAMQGADGFDDDDVEFEEEEE